MDDEAREARLTAANKTVRNYSLGSMGVGLIPIPIVDIAGLTGVQLKMLHSLAGQYEIPFSKDIVKPIIASLLGGFLPVGAVKLSAGSLAKWIPVTGTVIGMVSTAAFGGAASYAIGKVFIQHFESGGTFLDFDPEKVREHFKAEFEAAKEQLNQPSQPSEPQNSY